MCSALFTYFGLSYWEVFLFILYCPLSAAFHLHVHNNGPGVLDSNITFFAEVTGEGLLDSYIFEFEDNVFKSHDLVTEQRRKANFTVLYNSADNEPGTYEMKIKLYRSFIVFHELIAEKISKFNLTEYINGNLTVSGGKESFIPVGKPANITFNLEDQTGFFKNAQMHYVWEVNGVRHLDLRELLTYNATKDQSVDISLIVNAFIHHSSLLKWGFYNLHLEALSPVSNVTVIGNVFIQQGDVVNFEVSCNGSGPYHYCWKPFPSNQSQPNMTCVDPIVTTRCSFPYIHFFPDSGVHRIGVVIGNYLNTVNRTVEVHINDVSKKGQLSTVIVPIICSLLGIVIMVAGTAFHIHQRKKYSVEVADFDFQEPVLLVEKTFLERLKDSIKMALSNSPSEQTEVKRSPSEEKSSPHDTVYGSTDLPPQKI